MGARGLATLTLTAVLATTVGVPTALAGTGRLSAAAATVALDAAAPVVGDLEADSWLVVFRDDASSAQVDAGAALASLLGGVVGDRWENALQGFALEAGLPVVKSLLDLPGLAYVEADDRIRAAAVVEDDATWGIDRLDQRTLPLDARYETDEDGDQVRVYVLDTGVRSTHVDLAGRVLTAEGHDVIGGGTEDCNGHGTHVAGTVAGSTWGVAQAARVVPYRVLDCAGQGRESGLVSALDHLVDDARRPAVANLSLTGAASPSVDAAVRALLDTGVVVVAAAGNHGADACLRSPARVPGVLTVGAATATDDVPGWSNSGRCVDLFAPGAAIRSATGDDDLGSTTASGTSSAAAHAAGVAALALDAAPAASPATVTGRLVATATPDVLGTVGPTPDLLLHSDRSAGDLEDPNPVPGDADLCAGHDELHSGTIAAGEVVLLPADADIVVAERTRLAGCLHGSDGAELDLALFRRDPDAGEYELVAAGEALGAHEEVAAVTAAGTYVWAVRARSGGGAWRAGLSTDAVGGSGSPLEEPECTLDEATTGVLTGTGDSVVVGGTFALGVGDVAHACTGGPGDADFDLALEVLDGGSWVEVDASRGIDAIEEVAHTATAAASYRWVLRSFHGAGAFAVQARTTPTTTITSVTDRGDGTAVATFSSHDADATFRCSVDGAPATACASPATLSGLATGSHTLVVTAVDVHGTVDPSPASTSLSTTLPTPPPTPGPAPTTAPTPAPAPLPAPRVDLLGHERFADVTPDNVFSASIGKLAAAGITRGCNPPTNDRFCPSGAVTRGQMAAFLVRALDLPSSSVDQFADDDGSVFEQDIQALAAAGVTRGCNPPTNDRFCADAPLTRGQMAAFLVRALDLPADATDRFGDDDGSTFERDVQALAAAGITRGCNPPTNDSFCPDSIVTRGQMAAFLDRAGLTD